MLRRKQLQWHTFISNTHVHRRCGRRSHAESCQERGWRRWKHVIGRWSDECCSSIGYFLASTDSPASVLLFEYRASCQIASGYHLILFSQKHAWCGKRGTGIAFPTHMYAPVGGRTMASPAVSGASVPMMYPHQMARRCDEASSFPRDVRP